MSKGRKKYRPRKGSKKRWAVDRQPKMGGPHKEGMNVLYGDSSPTRQQSLSDLRRSTPLTKVTIDQLDAARNQGPVRRVDVDTGQVTTLDPVPPLLRVLNKRRDFGHDVKPLRVIPIEKGVQLICEVKKVKDTSFTHYYFVRERCGVKTFDFSGTFSSLARAFNAWKNHEVLWVDEISFQSPP